MQEYLSSPICSTFVTFSPAPNRNRTPNKATRRLKITSSDPSYNVLPLGHARSSAVAAFYLRLSHGSRSHSTTRTSSSIQTE